MITLFRRLGTCMAVAIVLSAGAFAAIAYANHSWGGYHWARTANPFTIKLGNNVSAIWNENLVTASTDWSVSSVLDTTIVAGQSRRNCQPTNGRVEVCNKTYGYNGWLGVASLWINGSHITQGTVKVNDTYFNNSPYNTPAWKQFVMCQEVGHTFGLDHQDVNFSNTNLGTCMDYTNDPDGTRYGQPNNLHPNAHDYDELGLIYTHLDTITTIGQTVSQLRGNDELRGNDDAAEANNGGTVLRKDSRGRPALYERDLGKGKKLLTFIFWNN